MKILNIKITNKDYTIPLYVINTSFYYIKQRGYEDAYSIEGVKIGVINKGYDHVLFNANEIHDGDIEVYNNDGYYHIAQNNTPLDITQFQYNCKDILIGYCYSYAGSYSDERYVFETFLHKMNDLESVVYVEDIDRYDNIRRKSGFYANMDSCKCAYKSANSFIEICISSQRRHNVRRLSDRVALLNWNKIKHIEHNQLLLKSKDKPTLKRMTDFLINRLNQKSIIAYNQTHYKQLIQMKL